MVEDLKKNVEEEYDEDDDYIPPPMRAEDLLKRTKAYAELKKKNNLRLN